MVKDGFPKLHVEGVGDGGERVSVLALYAADAGSRLGGSPEQGAIWLSGNLSNINRNGVDGDI